MQEFSYTVKDKMGLHARPAGLLMKKALTFPCKVTLVKDGKEADAKKVFQIMGLDVRCGQEITLLTSGDREEEASRSLRDFFNKNL